MWIARTTIVAGFLILTGCAGLSGCGPGPQPETLFAQGEELRRAYRKTASHRAIEAYGGALAAWERAGRPGEAARAAERIGATHEQLGSLDAALRAYQRALALAQESDDALLESEVRSALGFAQAMGGDSERALEDALSQCEAALTLARQSAGTSQEAKALNCHGEVEYHRGNLELALAFYQQAETLWNRTGDAAGQAETQLSQGYVYSDLSEFELARGRYADALALWISLPDTRGQALTLVADARLRQRHGEYQEALNRYHEALALLEPMGDSIWEASGLTGVADVYLQMGEVDGALRHWERALRLFEEAGVKNGAVDVLLAVGDTYLVAGDDARALERFERALTYSDELANRRLQAYALRRIGVVYVRRRLPGQARQFLERSLAAQADVADRRLEGETRADMGEVEALLGEPDRAVTWFQDALGLFRSAGDRLGEARVLFGLAQASIARGDLGGARRYVARSLEIAEALRTEVQRTDLRASYLASVHRYYELHVEVLMRLHDANPRAGMAAAAFEAAERARARSLLDSLTQAGVDLRAGVDPELLRREAGARQAFEEWSARQGQVDGRGREAEMAEAFRDLEERYNQIQAELRSRSPRYAALTQPRPSSLAAVQKQLLADDTVLLEYALGDRRSYMWVVSRTGYASYELPPRREIELLALKVYERLTARLHASGDLRERRRRLQQADDEYWTDAQRLSDILLGPGIDAMRGKRILVVADGALQHLPFAALPLPGSGAVRMPMITEHEIVSLPSASVLAALRNETRDRVPAAGAVAVLADPVFEGDDPRLRRARERSTAPAQVRRGPISTASASARQAGPVRESPLKIPRLAATRQEADAILAAAGDATFKAVDFAASRATAMSGRLAGYRILHFATHGILDDNDPGLGGIVLSMFDESGEPQDGLLRLHDIYGLSLPAELVVLSACNTALGKAVKGEGLVGMVRGFMYAGAKRVVASHWKVDDEATGELMARFYAEMFERNQPPAAALRQAQLAVRQQGRWQAPFYWAAFALQGEWK
ncbi:MAG TPA: CHAT domain-containing protein [Vicinamibacterales bacterium]|nr:CHAT domain-containing protein [Vicinamibacterales bacterium]